MFIEDGVIEVATDEKLSKTLEMHYKWGLDNGLEKNEIKMLEKKELLKIEPNLYCHSAILCNKDASVDFGHITQNLSTELSNNKPRVDFLTNSKVSRIKYKDGSNNEISIEYTNPLTGDTDEAKCSFLINAAGGNAINVLNKTKVIHQYKDLFFRGEYWIAPIKYRSLTNHSIYSVPEFPKFPFLDPHWIIRSNGNREIGPNACPVFSPYGYNYRTNAKEFFPKIFRLLYGSNNQIKSSLLNKEIFNLIYKESLSSISKTYMIRRVKKFLPSLQPRDFVQRGTSGIRSNVIDKEGNFLPNPIFLLNDNILHILNYNSPGATGAFPISYAIVFKLIEIGILKEDIHSFQNYNLTQFDQKIIESCKNEINIDFVN